MFSIKTFKLSDLVGRTLRIRKFTDKNSQITIAVDTNDGTVFVLERKYTGAPLATLVLERGTSKTIYSAEQARGLRIIRVEWLKWPIEEEFNIVQAGIHGVQ